MKICSICGENKENTDYYSRRNQCKKCMKENALTNYNEKKNISVDITNKICDKCGITKDILQFPKYRNVCKVCFNTYIRKKGMNADRKEYQKEYHKKYRNKYISNRRKNDILFRLMGSIGNLIRQSFKNKGYKKNSRTEHILGISYIDFKVYVEKQFVNDMSWDNRGTYWDIDHIIPLSNATSEAELIKLNHYTNLQPLDSYINRYVKRDRLDFVK